MIAKKPRPKAKDKAKGQQRPKLASRAKATKPEPPPPNGSPARSWPWSSAGLPEAAKQAAASGPVSRESAVLDVPVAFGGVSIGDEIARVGISIDRKLLTVEQAEHAFCGRRLLGRIVVSPGNDDPNQTYIPDTVSKHEIQSAFDVKRFSLSPKKISTGLAFAIGEIDVACLSHFARQSGRLIVGAVAEISETTRAANDAKSTNSKAAK